MSPELPKKAPELPIKAPEVVSTIAKFLRKKAKDENWYSKEQAIDMASKPQFYAFKSTPV